ncbi:MAG: amidohydrolase, partial [Candidatus Thermoplasmatota archaeon]|nr:amidohydrolase [Candidatus Thermoplasmatota archaeon]
VLENATVLTMADEHPETHALAIQGGRILALGEDALDPGLRGPNTRVMDLDGRTVLPGFVDCHTHAARLGELHFRADLHEVPDKHAALDILTQRAERTPPGGWVIAWNWDESTWTDQEPLTPEDLETVSREHPIMARRVCGHKAVVNRRALEELSLPDKTPGLVTADGSPTGLLTEDAADIAWERCAPTYETCKKGLTIESKRLASLGITTVADTAGPRDIELLTRGTREGWFLQRAGMYVREELLDHLEALRLGTIGAPRCRLLGVKTYTDGSIGARTAATTEPYRDEDTTGMLLRDAKQVEALAARATELGLQLKAHAIGDAAIQAVLDGVRHAQVPRRLRPRLEHLEMVRADQLQAMAELGVLAVIQPNFIGNWQGPEGLYQAAVGTERRLAMNPLASVLEAGVPLAFSSDGMPYHPLYGIRCALEHPNPAERLTVEQALAAYTRGAAYALGMEQEIGTLEEGKLADLIVLDEDPRSHAPVDEVGIALTMVGGRIVHEAGA